ncbi:MAG TPA: hypothetical protein VE860_18790 [Chthoniobacterales bacterium]|nr:hypothetical protein [Chthoniobacterales bacterium]
MIFAKVKHFLFWLRSMSCAFNGDRRALDYFYPGATATWERLGFVSLDIPEIH